MPIRRASDGRWRYREVIPLADGTKERISGSAPRYCNTKAAAQEALREHIERLRNPVAPPAPEKEVPLFEEFAKEFLENYVRANNKPAEHESKRSVLDCHLVPAFRGKRIDEIKPRLIEAYKAEKLRAGRAIKRKGEGPGLSWKTVNNHLTILRRMLAIAKQWEVIESIPDITWLKGPKAEFDFLDFEEAERLVASADEGEWRTMILLGLKTGMRQGELRALRWDDVDLHKGLIVVRQNIVRGHVGTPKSGKGREIPMSDQALAALKAHRHLRGELVFCNADGDYWKKNECKHPLWRACKRSGIRRIGWHVLRHSFASHLVMRGVPLKAIQELLGHATIEMTMRYSHLSPDVTRSAVLALDEAPPEYAGPRGKAVAKTPARLASS